MSRFKQIIGFLHLWSGLISGLIVFVIAITGCLYTFKEEIQDMTQSYRAVASLDQACLLPSELQKIAQAQLPNKLLHAVKYNEPGKSTEVIFYKFGESYYHTIYLNPYTGEVLKVNDNNQGFFAFVMQGHFNLWLPLEVGQPIVSVAVLVFVFLLVSGIVLWFPEQKRFIKQSLTVAWNSSTRWKRKNYDLHVVVGFYLSIFALVLALTGLVWGFEWFAQGLYQSAGGKKSLMYADPGVRPDTIPSENASFSALDSVYRFMVQTYPEAKSVEVHPPETDASSIAANANVSSSTYWKTDYRYFDQYTLCETSVNHVYGRLHEATFADKMMRMNYDIHVGAIGGFAGKLLVFLTSLGVAGLPVTGFLIWWTKRKRKR